MSVQPAQPMLSIEHRHAILQQAVAVQVSTFGQVVYQADTHAIVDFTQPTSHPLHIIICLLTCGLWVPVWLLLAIMDRPDRRSVYVNEWGQVHVQKIS